MYRQEKRFFLVSISLALILLLTGCWNRNELNELSIVLAMGIDKKDDLYEVSLQVVNPNQMSRKQSSCELARDSANQAKWEDHQSLRNATE